LILKGASGSGRAVTLAIAFQEAADAADGLAQVVLVGRNTTRKWSGAPVEAVPCTSSTFDSCQQFVNELLVVLIG
jgi:hypothetical protein